MRTSSEELRVESECSGGARTDWVSSDLQARWEEKFRKIRTAWSQIEALSVLNGERACCLASIPARELPETAIGWNIQGLFSLPIASFPSPSPTGSFIDPLTARMPYVIRVAIGNESDVVRLQRALEDRDEQSVLDSLGVPSCCRQLRQDYLCPERGEGPVASGSHRPHNVHQRTSVDGKEDQPPKPDRATVWWTNPAWRPLRLQATPHRPCHSECQESLRIGRRMLELGHDSGFDQEMKWLEEVLRWPVKWCRDEQGLNLKSPVLSWFRPRLVQPVQIESDAQLDSQGPDGPSLEGPFEHAWMYLENGFVSASAMREAHQPILDLAAAVLRPGPGSVLDLGCGNGALLRKLQDQCQEIVPYGIDSQAEGVRHAREFFPSFRENFVVGDLFDFDDHLPPAEEYSLILLMPGRLLDVTPIREKVLRTKLMRNQGSLLLYAYRDWLRQFGTIETLVRSCGLELQRVASSQTACLATWNAQ